MEVIWSVRSTNGRWGADIVSASVAPSKEGDVGYRNLRWPLRGTLAPLGRKAGIEAFRFDANEAATTWVLPGGDLEPIEGARSVWRESLQSSDMGTILVLGATAIVRSYGYKRRSSQYTLYREGVGQEATASLLLAAGLIEPTEPPAPFEPPPEPSTALADALRKAGFAK